MIPKSFDDLRELLDRLPPLDDHARQSAMAHDAQLTKPPGALGQLEAIAAWVSACQYRHPPLMDGARIVIFAANHGIARHGVSAFPAAVTEQMVLNFAAGGAAINQLAATANAELAVVDVGVHSPTADFSQEPAMDEAEFFAAFGAGFANFKPDNDVVAAGEMGIGNTTAAAALSLALYGGEAAEWTGPGTGVAGDALKNKTRIVEQSVLRFQELKADPLRLFAALGGKEMAAIAGFVTAARMNKGCVILDGYITTAAIAPLVAINPAFAAHCWPGHISSEPAHAALLGLLGLPQPILSLGLRLGEGSGAALAMGVVRSALACHNQMATFASAGVSTKSKETP